MIKIPLHDELSIAIDVNVPRAVVAFPGYEEIATATDLAQ